MISAFTNTMLDNPDLIASLIGFDGLLAIAVTAVLTRLLSDTGRAERLESAKDATLDKVAKLEATVDYLKEKLGSGVEIVADGRTTPSEISQVKASYEDIKGKIAEIVNRGGDAA